MSPSIPNPALTSESPIDTAVDSKLALFTVSLVKGDEAAWAEFHDHYRLRLLGYLGRIWHGEADCVDDLLQETFLRVVRHMRIFQEEDALWSWLTVLARSAVSDHGRRRTRWWNFLRRWRLEGELRAIPSAPERFVPQLEQALGALDDDTRSLLEAKYYQRQSVRDLAAQHGVTEKAIEARLARARQHLTKQFAQNPTDS